MLMQCYNVNATIIYVNATMLMLVNAMLQC